MGPTVSASYLNSTCSTCSRNGSPPLPLRRLQCPRLRGIQSMGAGVDHMVGEPSLPRHVPLLRVIDLLM